MPRTAAAFACLLILAAAPGSALAWGNTGHRIVGRTAMRGLPADMPGFLRTPQAVEDVGELSREPDRSKGGGKVHDSNRDPAHFLDLDDEGKVLGGPALGALPPTRAEYETALQAVGHGSWDAGYLPYAIVDAQQQVARDLAYWRALVAAERNPAWKAHRAWFTADRKRREAQVLASIGQLSHFVADGSQPLHVSVHHHGWGEYPNPNNYPVASNIHSAFEGELVRDTVRPDSVAADMTPFQSCGCPIETRVATYLAATARQVVPLYQLDRTGALREGDERGRGFAEERLAAGASELRDLIVEAWRASGQAMVGWAPVSVADIEAGRVDAYLALSGKD